MHESVTPHRRESVSRRCQGVNVLEVYSITLAQIMTLAQTIPPHRRANEETVETETATYLSCAGFSFPK